MFMLIIDNFVQQHFTVLFWRKQTCCFLFWFKFNWKSAIFCTQDFVLIVYYLICFYYCMAFIFGYISVHTWDIRVKQQLLFLQEFECFLYTCKENKHHNSIFLCYLSIMSVATANVYNFNYLRKPFYFDIHATFELCIEIVFWFLWV